MSRARSAGTNGSTPGRFPPRYDPWHDLARHWPEVTVRTATMTGDLLGLVRYPVIVLRADTTAGQRRSTLTHEIVHLERGIEQCGEGSPYAAREEAAVEAEAARRLIRVGDLVAALRDAGPQAQAGTLAALLEVDGQLLAARLSGLDAAERSAIAAAVGEEFGRFQAA